VGFGILVLELDRLAIVFGSLFVIVLVVVDDPEIVLRLRRLRVDRDGAL
jgi:hypothetical protein